MNVTEGIEDAVYLLEATIRVRPLLLNWVQGDFDPKWLAVCCYA